MIPGVDIVSSWVLEHGKTAPLGTIIAPPTAAQAAAEAERRAKVLTDGHRRRERRRTNEARHKNGARDRRAK